MKIVSTLDRGFQAIFRRVCTRSLHQNGQVERNVRSILRAVEQHGDAAVVRYAKKFDGVRLKPSDFLVRPEEIKQAHAKIRKEEGDALRFAARRIRGFHERQRFTRNKAFGLASSLPPWMWWVCTSLGARRSTLRRC